MTKTMTGPGPTEAEKEIDFDHEFYNLTKTGVAPPCEVPTGCDEVAKFACTLTCCAQMILICETHFDAILERINSWIENGIKFGCPWCGNVVESGKPFSHVERV